MQLHLRVRSVVKSGLQRTYARLPYPIVANDLILKQIFHKVVRSVIIKIPDTQNFELNNNNNCGKLKS